MFTFSREENNDSFFSEANMYEAAKHHKDDHKITGRMFGSDGDQSLLLKIFVHIVSSSTSQGW